MWLHFFIWELFRWVCSLVKPQASLTSKAYMVDSSPQSATFKSNGREKEWFRKPFPLVCPKEMVSVQKKTTNNSRRENGRDFGIDWNNTDCTLDYWRSRSVKSNYLIYKLNKSLSESFVRIEEARTAGWKWRQPLAFNQFPKYQRRRPIPSLAAAKMHKLAFAVSSEISK